MNGLLDRLLGDHTLDRAVPPSGFTARLTAGTAAAMAFLAVFALAFATAAGQLADRWSAELAGSATVRVVPDPDPAVTESVLSTVTTVLGQTPGVVAPRALTLEESQALLTPVLGPDLPLDALPVPRLVTFGIGEAYDATGLAARLEGEAPGAVLDDHAAWRAPLVASAGRLRALAWVAVALAAGGMAALVALAAEAAMAANAQVIGVLRQVGARDATIAAAFERRFTLRAGLGAVVGTGLALGALALVPNGADALLAGVGFRGAGWIWPLLVPPLAAALAFGATRIAARRRLREVA